MADAQSDLKRSKQLDEVFCESCGVPVKEQAEHCPHCGIRRRRQRSTPSSEKEPIVAAITSLFIPGLGDLYNGEIAISAVVFIGYVVIVSVWSGFLLLIALLTLGNGAIFWVFWPIILLLNPLSALFSYWRAEQINAGELEV